MVEIVFVHLGTKIPKILSANISWISNIFPNKSITLITDLDIPKNKILKKVKVYTLQPSSPVFRLNQTPHALSFRKGYWLHTIRRLLALADWHSNYPETSFLHVESDMLLMKDFPFEKIDSLKTLAWPNVSDVRDMPGLLFSPNSEASQWLADKLLEQIELYSDTTDMLALRRIAEKYPSNHTYFSTMPQRPPQANGALNHKDSAFIFDGLTLGMWFAGEDPRNHWGLVVRGKNYIDHCPITEKLELRKGNQGLEARYRDQKDWFGVSNLHIHSKNLGFFSLVWHEAFIKRNLRFSRLRIRYTFSPRGFVGALLQLVEAGLARFMGIRTKIRGFDDSSN